MVQQTVWGSAKYAGWKQIEGKAKLSIVFVFGVKRRRDTDNLYGRAKHVVDALKPFFVDDDTEHLDLSVTALFVPGVRETRLTLESV